MAEFCGWGWHERQLFCGEHNVAVGWEGGYAEELESWGQERTWAPAVFISEANGVGVVVQIGDFTLVGTMQELLNMQRRMGEW